MSKIDEIMAAAQDVADAHAGLVLQQSGMREIILNKEVDGLRALITAALADAERKGAEQMREACATASEEIARRFSGRKPTVQFSNGSAAAAKTIRALHLPTGSQQ